MIKYYSLGIKLDNVVSDPEFERIVLENIRGCSRTVGKLFKVVFRHVNLTEQNCKDFVKRNEHLLFEVNTQITKGFEPVWFLIDSDMDIRDSSNGRYRFDGDILQGVSEYLRIINHIKKRDGE